MPFPFFLAALIGKAASGAVSNGLTAKVSAATAKALVGSHGHHGFAQKLASAAAEKLSDKAVDAALAKKKNKGKRDG